MTWPSATSARAARAMSEYLGARRVQRSAHAVTYGERLTIYLGVCDDHQRPVRQDMETDRGPSAKIVCPVGGELITGERLIAIETDLECDGACRSARRNFCSCGCGGINHGNTWTRGYLLDQREVVESEVERYRASVAKIEVKREQRREAAATKQRREFEGWFTQHAAEVQCLSQVDTHTSRSNFVADMAREINGRHALP